VTDVEVSEYVDQVTGLVDLQVDLSGTLADPQAEVDISSASVNLFQQEMKDIKLHGLYNSESIAIDLEQMYFQKNKITGEGDFTQEEGLNFILNGRNFHWNYDQLEFDGDLRTEIGYNRKVDADIRIRNLTVKHNDMTLSELILRGHLRNNLFDLTIISDNSDLILNCDGDLAKKEIKLGIELSSFNLARLLNNNSLPQISGSLNVEANEDQIITDAVVRIFDRNYSDLGGRFIFDSNLDLKNKRSEFNLRSSKASFNFEPFSLNISATGDLDSLKFNKFEINREINVQGCIKTDPQLQIIAGMNFDSINIKDYLKYFSSSGINSTIKGEASLQLDYNNQLDKQISGSLHIKDLKYNQLKDLDILTEFSGSLTDMTAGSSVYLNKINKIIDLNTKLKLLPEFSVNSSGRIDDLELNDLFPNDEASGILNAGLDYFFQSDKRTLDLNVEVDDLNVAWFEADSLKLDLVQHNESLEIRNFEAGKRKRYNTSASGKIGYNFLNSDVYPDSNTIELRFDGDLLRMLSGKTSIINGGRSQCQIGIKVGLDENGLSINDGEIQLSKASFKVKGQLETVEDIKVSIDILDNDLHVVQFTAEVGKGKVFIENLIENDDNEFILGNLRIGKLFVYTNEEGILAHIPQYMPGNSVAKAVIKGRNTDKLAVYGPFEDIMIIGDIYVYNGSGIYPSNTDNLVKFVAKMTEESSTVEHDIPLSFDLLLHFEENVRYVTYPLNLLTDQGSYLNLKFDGEEFTAPDALFTSENGFIDIFGTQMQTDFVQVKISPYQDNVQINGSFYKKTSDGTLITLIVTSINDPASNKVFALDFDLQSDNSNDSRTDILALLRYGRRQDEISPDQKKTLLQDEVIQLAGLGIESAVLDPFISPVETWVRRVFNLDFFHLQTDLIQNIFNRYSSDNTDYVVDEEGKRLSHNTGELFLNNLSIGMGKYLSRKFFLDYELEFQKPQDLSVESDMGVYHNFSIRYDLPFRMKLALKYHIYPFNEKNDHEITLEKSFRF